MEAYADLADMPEDTRILVIVETMKKLPSGKMMAVCVDDFPGKPERYKKKLAEKGKGIIEFIEQFNGPVPKVITLKYKRL